MPKVLLIDDEKSLRWLVAMALKSEGHVVTEAGDGEAALEQCEAEQFDLIICDVNLPGKSGTEMLVEFRQLQDAAKIIFMSGGDIGDEIMQAAARQPGVRAIAKPFAATAMNALVAEMLAPTRCNTTQP